MRISLDNYRKYSAHDFVLDEYFQLWVGSTNIECNEFWQGWLVNNPDKRQEIEEAQEFLKQITFPNYSLSQASVAALWRKVQMDTGMGASKNILFLSSLRMKQFAAAAMLITSFVSFIFWTSEQQLTEYTTTFGETKTIILPDSSKVILNANSQISFNDHWEDQTAREVWLDGEAFFSVRHKIDHQSFKVKTSKGVNVEVLGTEFNVYHRSQETKVLLSSGQITLSFPMKKKEGKILMKPGELVEFKRDKFKLAQVNPINYVSWTEQKINLNKTPLREMIRMASDNYGLEIQVQKSEMLDQTASGTMPLGDSQSFVANMTKIFQIEAVYENNRYLFLEPINQTNPN
ncbi:MAG: FecR domain-containing protein [Cyclobacteriaceae bacterium]|nr:FecR domain-containing protein [Cyclobacteriaceae bacterium]